jgi:pyrimidine operon attenuation protein/uracil phosphoribosyltransferase
MILIDDVLYTGRAVCAVLIGREFRELPIEARRYVGIRYQSEELMKIGCKETDGVTELHL